MRPSKRPAQIFLLGILISLKVLAEPIPGTTLLEFFRSNCNESEWTQAALGESMAIIQTLNGLAEDPDCKSLGGAVANLNALNSQLTGLQSLNTAQEQIAMLDSQEQELMVQLSGSSDPLVIESISTSLRTIQLNRASYIGQEGYQSQLMSPGKLQLMSGVVQLANITMSQLAANQRCLKKNPGLLNAAAGITSAVGAAAVFVNPALGFGLTVGSTLMGATLENIRVGGIYADVRRLADNTVAPQAYKCALKSMTDRWCQMRDAEVMVKFKIDHRRPDPQNPALPSAIGLSDREIPRVIEFFDRIRSGVVPSTTPDASRLNSVLLREYMVRSFKANGIALIEEKRPIYEAAITRDDKWLAIRNIVNVLAPGFTGAMTTGHGVTTSPMFEVKSEGYAPFFLVGVKDGQDLIQNGTYIRLDSWQRPATHELSLDDLKANFNLWVDQAERLVNQEMGQVLQPDEDFTLANAYDPLGNPWKISFMQSLGNIIAFLEKNPPSETNAPFRKIFMRTLTSLREIRDIVENAANSNSVILEASAIEQIYAKAQLKYGVTVMQMRLDLIVRVSLLQYLQSSPPEDQVLVAQMLAATRFNDSIKRFNGLENTTRTLSEIKNAKRITLQNLNAFVDIFGENINKTLARWKSEERNSGSTAAELARNSRTEMCFLLLGADKSRYSIHTGYCDGVQLASEVGGPSTVVLSPDTFRQDVSKRACMYPDFFRANKIYEDWGIKR